jgi:GTPase SAR1 family protein
MISRILVDRLRQKLFKQKAIIVLGPRQVGKTTLLKNLAFDPDEILWMNADEIDVQQTLSEVSSGSFKALLGKKKIYNGGLIPAPVSRTLTAPAILRKKYANNSAVPRPEVCRY